MESNVFREKYRTQIVWGVTVLVLLVLAISCYFLFLRMDDMAKLVRTVTGVLTPLSFGLVIAYLLDSMVAAFTRLLGKIPRPKKWNAVRLGKFHRGLSILISEVLLLVLIAAMIGSIIPQLIDSLMTIISNIDVYAANLERWGKPLLDEYPEIAPYVMDQYTKLEALVKEYLQNDLLTLIGTVTNGLFEAGTYVYNFLLGLIVSIYLLASKGRLISHFKKLLYAVLRPSAANRALSVGRYTNRVFKGFLVGKIVDSAIIGVLCFFGTTLLNIPYSLLISIVVGVTNVIPYFGPFIGAIPTALLVLMLNPYKCLVFVIFVIVLQQLDGNVIGPRILGNTTGVSSLGVLISILVGGGLFGLMGMVLCVPTYAVIYTLIKRMAERRLRKRSLPTDGETYLTLEKIDPESGRAVAMDAAGAAGGAGESLLKRALGRKKK